MSTFCVFGMTRAMASDIARKKTATTCNGDPIPMSEYLLAVEASTDKIMEGSLVLQLSPMFDEPQYAERFIELARKSGECRDMRIRAKAALMDAQGKPITNPKTKVPRYGFMDWAASA